MTSKTATISNINQNDIASLNKEFNGLDYRQRLVRLYEVFPVSDILVTSSFGTNSAFLLHVISKIMPQQTITFIDTTYHFPETLQYKNTLTRRLGLNVKSIFPDPVQNRLTTEESWWKEHPNMCCSVNKIAPLKNILGDYKIWISGLMAHQSKHRAKLKIFENRGDIIKFHPLIDIEEAEYLYQKGYHKLPEHPLLENGYESIGCKHCTIKGKHRAGRWVNSEKTECGLHTSFFYHKNRSAKNK